MKLIVGISQIYHDAALQNDPPIRYTVRRDTSFAHLLTRGSRLVADLNVFNSRMTREDSWSQIKVNLY